MVLIKNGMKQELNDQVMIDAFLNSGWEPAKEPAPAPEKPVEEAPAKRTVTRKR